mmetsp:Transcript_6756/g.23748  ORF Transcript_6756/g.23748 Transcript_6756/m.23748 type:complete len:108 (-) Transcript_6756:770-1093(-)
MQAQAQSASGHATAASESPYLDLEVVTKHGITKTDVNKFKDAGYHTVESVLYTVKKNLLLIKGITEAKIDKVLEAIQKEKSFSFKTGVEALHLRKRIKKITTGTSMV